jgi:phosphosulfolactate synthase (CoM biosynthesis protein A)
MIMIESEGITEEVTTWRTDVVATIARELGLVAVPGGPARADENG